MCCVIVVPTQDGDRFWKIPEVFIRGNTIKYLRIPDEVRAQPSASLHNHLSAIRCPYNTA
jgi:hypothetical protein